MKASVAVLMGGLVLAWSTAVCAFEAGTSSGAASTSYDGAWVSKQEVAGSEVPYSIFDLKLSHVGHRYEGKYCFVTRFGGKIDCDPKVGSNAHGSIGPDGVLHMTFSPYAGDGEGRADISMQDGRLLWLVTKQPGGDWFFGPNKALLDKDVH